MLRLVSKLMKCNKRAAQLCLEGAYNACPENVYSNVDNYHTNIVDELDR